MKKRLIKLIPILFVCAMLIATLTACSTNRTIKYDFLVTFDYNTENLDDASCENQYLGVNNGSRIMAPVGLNYKTYSTSSFKEIQLARYEVQAWYLPKYNDDGSVAKDGDGNVILDREWDFAHDVVTSNITLYAKLTVKPLVSLIYDGKAQRERRFTVGARVTELSVSPIEPKLDGKTFYGYYLDEEYTVPCTFPFAMGNDAVNIYAKFIDGENWRIVKTAGEFASAYNASAKIYLDNDIDFSRAEWYPGKDDEGVTYTQAEWMSKLEFSGEISGNGHTIKNITATVKNTINSGELVGLFGRLTASSYIHDITFENANVTVEPVGNTPFMAALFAWTIDDGARLINVNISGQIQCSDTNRVSLRGFTTRNADNMNNVTIYNCVYNGEPV